MSPFWLGRQVRNAESKVVAWTPEDERLLRERIRFIAMRNSGTRQALAPTTIISDRAGRSPEPQG